MNNPDHQKKTYIFDFDSTLTRVEALEELGKISLQRNPKKKIILDEIKHLTDQGMNGSMPFDESLTKRLLLLRANQTHLDQLITRLKKKISPSVQRNKSFFKLHTDEILVVSGGFKEFIDPIMQLYGIKPNQIFANTFTFNKKGEITGHDRENDLSKPNGKELLLEKMNLKGEIHVIGDGYGDYMIKKSGQAHKFFAFTENIARREVTALADHIVPNLDEFLYQNNLPMNISYPKNRIRVLILENIHPDAASISEEEGYTVETTPGSLNEQELALKMKDISVLCIRSKTRISEHTINNAKKLLAIGAYCIGTNQIDLKACMKKGVAVFNAPYSNTRSVVELAIGEIIMLMRGIFQKSNLLHAGEWRKSAENSFEIRGKTLGIIGYGNIGSQLSVLAESLGMNVLYYDMAEKPAFGNAAKCDTVRELLRKSDVVSIHVDGNKSTINLIGEKELKLMKTGAVLLNLSRGHVVNITALKKHLESGKLLGAAIDVYPEEPKKNEDRFTSELRHLPNVILTPHIGGSTLEAQKSIAEHVTTTIINYINTGNSIGSVNIPNLQLPEFKNSHRLLHIHHNVPGIMAQINGVFAKNNINVLGQHLKTNETIGYLITDIDKAYDNTVIEELKKAENTVRLRVLY